MLCQVGEPTDVRRGLLRVRVVRLQSRVEQAAAAATMARSPPCSLTNGHGASSVHPGRRYQMIHEEVLAALVEGLRWGQGHGEHVGGMTVGALRRRMIVTASRRT